MRKLGNVRLNGNGGLTIDVEPEVLASFMSRHGALYRGLRALVVKLVEQEQSEGDTNKSHESGILIADAEKSAAVAVPEACADEAVMEMLKPPLPEPPPPPPKPPRPGRPGPRACDGTPYIDGVLWQWIGRRKRALAHGEPFTEDCPYYWD